MLWHGATCACCGSAAAGDRVRPCRDLICPACAPSARSCVQRLASTTCGAHLYFVNPRRNLQGLPTHAVGLGGGLAAELWLTPQPRIALIAIETFVERAQSCGSKIQRKESPLDSEAIRIRAIAFISRESAPRLDHGLCPFWTKTAAVPPEAPASVGASLFHGDECFVRYCRIGSAACTHPYHLLQEYTSQRPVAVGAATAVPVAGPCGSLHDVQHSDSNSAFGCRH